VKRENYTVDKLVLAQTSAVPSEPSVVVVAGRRTISWHRDRRPQEVSRKGGKLLLEIDPTDAPMRRRCRISGARPRLGHRRREQRRGRRQRNG
jgi:hypothetical protein